MTLADVLFVLEGGSVQQRGAPLEVYRRPANRFVAGFLGSPAMSFLPGRIDRQGGSVRVMIGADGDTVALAVRDPDAFSGLDPERKVVVGIRPHDVEPVADPLEADLVVEVGLVETLGPNVNVHGVVAELPFVATLEGTEGPGRGERLGLRVQELHLFDFGGGVSLRD